MNKLSFWIKFSGVILFCFLIYKVGWAETLNSIKKVSIVHLLVGVFVLWMAFYLKSVRWKIVSNSYGIPITNFKAFQVFFIGLFLANITPGKLGDFGRLFYIKEQLPNRKIGWSSLIMDRVFDLICLVIFSLIALVYYQVNFSILKLPHSYWSIFFCILVLFFGASIFFMFRKRVRLVIKPWKEAFNSHILSWGTGLMAFGITCVSMVLIYGVFNYIAWGMNIPINHLGLFLGAFILGVLTLLPVTVLGIGIRETSLVLIFQLYGLPSQDAIALSLVVFLLQIISFIPGAIWFYFSPVQLSKLKDLQ